MSTFLNTHRALWHEDSNGCYVWGGTTLRGYAQVWVPGECSNGIFRRGKSIRAYRITTAEKYGPLPKGLERSHVCGNKLCIRAHPEHIVYETRRENMLRMPPEQRKAMSQAALNSMTPEQRKANSIRARSFMGK